jgi:hypothetical protein
VVRWRDGTKQMEAYLSEEVYLSGGGVSVLNSTWAGQGNHVTTGDGDRLTAASGVLHLGQFIIHRPGVPAIDGTPFDHPQRCAAPLDYVVQHLINHPRLCTASLLLVQRIILDASIARAMSSSIHPFYRVWFTTIDPVLSLSGVLGNLFAPAAILRSYSPSFVSPPATETTVLLYTAAGFLAGHMLLSIGLLRAKPNDVTVWRAFQANSSIVDFFMIAGLAQAASV